MGNWFSRQPPQKFPEQFLGMSSSLEQVFCLESTLKDLLFLDVLERKN